jgi:hypothetical protein
LGSVGLETLASNLAKEVASRGRMSN